MFCNRTIIWYKTVFALLLKAKNAVFSTIPIVFKSTFFPFVAIEWDKFFLALGTQVNCRNGKYKFLCEPMDSTFSYHHKLHFLLPIIWNDQVPLTNIKIITQKQPATCVLIKRCSGNMQQIYREHPCWSVISIKLLWNFIKITFQHGCFPVNLLHIFRITFTKNTSGQLPQIIVNCKIVTIPICHGCFF